MNEIKFCLSEFHSIGNKSWHCNRNFFCMICRLALVVYELISYNISAAPTLIVKFLTASRLTICIDQFTSTERLRCCEMLIRSFSSSDRVILCRKLNQLENDFMTCLNSSCILWCIAKKIISLKLYVDLLPFKSLKWLDTIIKSFARSCRSWKNQIILSTSMWSRHL